MKICHFDFSKPLELVQGSGVLVCENPARFVSYCKDFVAQQRGEDGNFYMEDGGASFSFKKGGSIIFDFFNLSLGDKKVVAGLYKQLTQIVDENLQQEYTQLVTHLVSLIDSIAVESPIAIDYDVDFEFPDFLKTAKVRPKDEEVDFVELVADYLDASAKFLGIKLFVLVNLRTFLSDDEFLALLSHIGYSSYNVLFLERTQFPRVKCEPIRLIDADLCEIIVESSNPC